MPPASPEFPTRATEREWVSFEDDEEARTWVFDVTFLLSPWTCIYGQGCQGVLTGPTPEAEQGCCSYGAHFTDEADVARVEAEAETLDDDDWQFRRRGIRTGVVKHGRSGVSATRLVDGACVFLNRPGFEGGAGCALHRGAVRQGRRPMDLKPDVCWQLPLRREDREDGNGHVTSTVVEWSRDRWGEGGAEFHWWCTEAPEAFIGRGPLYQEMGDELTAMVGKATYDRLCEYLRERVPAGVPLPHPTLRPR